MQTLGDIAFLFLQLGVSGVGFAILLLAVGLLLKVRWIYSLGMFFAGAGFLFMFLGDSFGGGTCMLVVFLLAMWGLVKLGGWRFRSATAAITATPVVTPPTTTPAATPTPPAAPIVAPTPTPTPSKVWTAIGWIVLSLLGICLGLGAMGNTFPGSTWIDPLAQVLGQIFSRALSINSQINSGYSTALFILIAAAIARLLWKK